MRTSLYFSEPGDWWACKDCINGGVQRKDVAGPKLRTFSRQHSTQVHTEQKRAVELIPVA